MTRNFINLQTNKMVQSSLIATSGYKKAMSTVTTVFASLQPVSAEKTQLYGGAMGKTYQMFLDNGYTVNDNDYFQEVESGKRYKVVNGGVTRRVFGSTDYKTIIVVEIN